MKYFLFVLLLCFAASCTHIAVHEKVADIKISSFAKEVRETDHLELFMYGGGMWEQINSFDIGFISNKAVNVDEARLMYIDISTRFLNYINSDIDLCQYSSVFPFTINQLDLVIMFNPDPHKITGPYINFVSMGPLSFPQRDWIYFHEQDLSTGTSKIILTENYNKALNILKVQQCKRYMDAELQYKDAFK